MNITEPNFISAISDLIFLIVPACAVIVAITTRRKYWILAIGVALFSIPIDVHFFFDQYTCQSEFCGLGDFFEIIIISTIFGVLALIISFISAPKVIRNDQDLKAARKALFLLLLVVLTPIFLFVMYVILSPPHTETVLIDIQPKVIPVNSNTTIRVGILSTYPFKPTSNINPSTVRFGPNNAASTRVTSQDINGDGVSDLLFYFNANQAGIKLSDTQGCLTGSLKNGIRVVGCSPIRAVNN